ncbi:MAG: HDOD domain-containing protein, partial [Gammaproteobacteria bacterium]
ANAAYFGQKNSISTVREAIIRVLGINMVKSMALSIAVSGVFQTNSCSGFDAQEYWFNAIGCATLSRMMALRIPAGERPDPDMVYLGGLLHNLGCLVLAHVFPSKLSHVMALKADNPNANLEELQQEYLGVDWVSAGEWLVSRWHLPGFVGEAMRSVADDETPSDRYDIAMIRCAVKWIASNPENESGRSSLKQCCELESIPGLSDDALDIIEVKFFDQCEELHALAACL